MKSFYQGKHVLVTGAAGFIGSHLTDALLEAGARVTGVDNFITGRAQNIAHLADNSSFKLVHADVSGDPSQFIPEDIDLVFHMASPASPPGYQEHPVETYLVNSVGTHNMLQYFLLQNPDVRFLFASTSESYGDPLVHPQTEDYYGNVNPNGVRSMYDEAKRFGEMVCGVHFRSFDMNTRIIRIFNTYGPRMDPSDGRSLVEFAVKAIRGETVSMYGDGEQTRSYCYVEDLVAGIMAMMASDKTAGETVNLGNPHEQSMLELIKAIETILETKVKISHQEARPDDPRRRQPDITKAKKILGWEPRISIEDGLARTLDYFKQELQ